MQQLQQMRPPAPRAQQTAAAAGTFLRNKQRVPPLAREALGAIDPTCRGMGLGGSERGCTCPATAGQMCGGSSSATAQCSAAHAAAAAAGCWRVRRPAPSVSEVIRLAAEPACSCCPGRSPLAHCFCSCRSSRLDSLVSIHFGPGNSHTGVGMSRQVCGEIAPTIGEGALSLQLFPYFKQLIAGKNGG